MHPDLFIIDAWRADIANAYISNALAYEYADVLSRKLSARRWDEIKPVLGYLLEKARFTSIYYTWRPSSPAPGDEHIIEFVNTLAD